MQKNKNTKKKQKNKIENKKIPNTNNMRLEILLNNKSKNNDAQN